MDRAKELDDARYMCPREQWMRALIKGLIHKAIQWFLRPSICQPSIALQPIEDVG
jgi:hypothetical protein